MHWLTNCHLEMLPAVCALMIGQMGGTPVSTLGLAEAEVYDISGAKVPTDRLKLTVSTLATGSSASACIDGNTSTICQTAAGDPSPYLRIEYPCSGGVTEFSQVVVTNRKDCCQSSLGNFQMRMLNSAGVPDREDYAFAGSSAVYTVPGIGSGGKRTWLLSISIHAANLHSCVAA